MARQRGGRVGRPNRQPDITTAGGRIKFLRLGADLTQEQLAERVAELVADQDGTVRGVDQSVVARWESGERYPTPIQQQAIAEILGATRQFLFDGDALGGAA